MQAVSRSPSKLSRSVLVGYCALVGTMLLRLPWTETWDNQPFLWLLPALRPLLLSPYLRGAVSGCGLLLLWNALLEIREAREIGLD
jgi:hypothetical protein